MRKSFLPIVSALLSLPFAHAGELRPVSKMTAADMTEQSFATTAIERQFYSAVAARDSKQMHEIVRQMQKQYPNSPATYRTSMDLAFVDKNANQAMLWHAAYRKRFPISDSSAELWDKRYILGINAIKGKPDILTSTHGF